MVLRATKYLVAFALAAFASPAVEAQTTGQSIPEKLANDRPTFDRIPFQRSAESVARADLLACRNRNATSSQPRDMTVEEMSKALHGTWVNRKARTVHGLLVDSDTVFYIDMKGDKGNAILIDRNNLGRPVLTNVFEPGGRFAEKNLKRPLFMAQVNCSYEFVDHYVKVSDEVLLDALTATTSASLPADVVKPTGNTLQEIWKGLVQARYFEFLDMPTQSTFGPTQRVMRQLGDKSRIAILPEGATVTEGGIEQGHSPGTEYHLPMLTGGFFDISLKPVKHKLGAAGNEYQGVHMRWDAEYRGVGIGLTPGAAVPGVEEGEFFGEADAMVSARSISKDSAWMTSECGEKNGLATTLLEVAKPSTTTQTAVLIPALVFERFVLGRP